MPNVAKAPEERYLQVLVEQGQKTRHGLGLVFAVLMPGLGPLFAGAYVPAIFYLVGYAVCLYMAMTKGSWWLLAAFLVWMANIVHTQITLEMDSPKL